MKKRIITAITIMLVISLNRFIGDKAKNTIISNAKEYKEPNMTS